MSTEQEQNTLKVFDVYVACPYSDPDLEVRYARAGIATQYAASLIKDGIHTFSPLTHSHPMASAGELPGEWEFWEEIDRRVLSVSGEMHVLVMEGLKDSVGVGEEIKIAWSLGLPIKYILAIPEEDDLTFIEMSIDEGENVEEIFDFMKEISEFPEAAQVILDAEEDDVE